MKPEKNRRRVCHFSCGAASAVAAKLTLANYPRVAVVNAFVAEEHDDNRRFLRDVEQWLGVEIVQLRDTTHNASAYEVFRRSRFIKSRNGAKCTSVVKRRVLDAWKSPDDVHVLGYTVEEKNRADRYLDHEPDAEFPLIDAGVTKAECLAILDRTGIILPVMYRMGYSNANCIGCVKGGAGYWNKIRRDFPDRFEEMAAIEELVGEAGFLFRDRNTGKRISLRQLDPASGRHDEPEIECGFVCLAVEDQLADKAIGGGR